ncbi:MULTISPECIES: MFS transporter [unclassified Haladaptatus]|uniref:MFS transporter n=1 Tax=unclassified Haladaptatus TaxID=2622732 RepID=UPI0023E87680|nr:MULTISPECIES: MFS transporter [unclassified Haladaptatus]
MSRRQLFGSLCAMVFLVNLGRVLFAPLLEPLIVDFETTRTTMGLVATLAWMGSALPRIPTGYLLTRVRRHRVVLLTGFILTAASLFTAAASSVEMLMVGSFSMGVASGAYFIAANPLVSELYPQRLGRAIGVHGMSSQMAAVLAPLLVTAVLFVDDWRSVFQLVAVVALLATAVLFLVARRTDIPQGGASDRNLLTAVKKQWRIILAGIAFVGVASFVWNGLFNWYPSYLTVKGLSPETSRTMLSVVFAAGVPAFLVGGRFADRFDTVRLQLAIVGAFALSLVALTFAAGLIQIIVVSTIIGFVIHSMFPTVDTFLLSSLPDQHRASAYSVYSGTMMPMQATGSYVVGGLTDVGYSYGTIYQFFAVCLVGVMVVLFVLNRAGRIPRRGRTDA